MLKTLKLFYLGAARDRKDQPEATAYGHDGLRWSIAIPVSVLKAFFGLNDFNKNPTQPLTLYAVLGVAPTATPDQIKSMYRKAAKQWHPDVCKEPRAEEQFKRINEAYQILSDDQKRRKYEAGLKFEASLNGSRPKTFTIEDVTWRPPLRCGWVLAEGREVKNANRKGFDTFKFYVSKILSWEDITNDQGQTMVSSWKPNHTGNDLYYEIAWR